MQIIITSNKLLIFNRSYEVNSLIMVQFQGGEKCHPLSKKEAGKKEGKKEQEGKKMGRGGMKRVSCGYFGQMLRSHP